MINQQPLTTDLIGDKTLKTDAKINLFGEIDELSAFIMEFTHHTQDAEMNARLVNIVKTLFKISAEVAGSKNGLTCQDLDELMTYVNFYNEKAGDFNGFVLPGITPIGAKAHVVRTVTRRAERAYANVYEVYGGSEIIFEYLNKLSTMFYAIARTYDENKR